MIAQRSVSGRGDYRVNLRTLAPSCTIAVSSCHWLDFLSLHVG